MMRNAELVAISADQRMTRCAYACLLFLAGIADGDGMVEATLADISTHTGFDRGQLSRTIKELIDQGRLERTDKGRSVYRIPSRVCTPAHPWSR